MEQRILNIEQIEKEKNNERQKSRVLTIWRKTDDAVNAYRWLSAIPERKKKHFLTVDTGK